MSQNKMLMTAWARSSPRRYWLMQSTMFYGLASLLDDIASTLGWSTGGDWLARLGGAVFFGGIMLWLARGRVEHAPPVQ